MFSATLAVADLRYAFVANVRHSLYAVLSPVQHLVNLPFHLYQLVVETTKTHDELLKENISLRYQQTLLQSKLQRLVGLQHENKDLRRLLSYVEPAQDTHFLLAELMQVHSHPYRRFVVINRGYKQDVSVGLAVFDAFGVMGQVVDVGSSSALVMLITDPRSAVPVKNSRTSERALLVGGADNATLLSLSFVSKTSDVRPGDQWVTSGLGGRFPEGYPVGKVETVSNGPEQPFLGVKLAPLAHLNKSRLMLLAWQDKHDLDVATWLSKDLREGKSE